MTSSQVLATSPVAATRYSLLLTTDPDEVESAQRLRHRVFADELGATLHTTRPGLDVERFDAFCDHLLVRDDGTGDVVGTYRVLPPARARAAGGLYAEGEFDLSALGPLRPALVETGRSCVDPAHRNGAVVGLVWAGLGRYMVLTGHRWLVGCASVPLADGGALAASVWEQVRRRHLAPADRRVRPHLPWQAPPADRPLPAPPLLRGYLRLGAQVCGPPALDPDFDCADFLVLLDVLAMDERYARFFALGDGR
ncbi:GNAT family N-acetyltransferase [Pseudonocardia sp.]|uniref:GNAT family N-acetyltransferase n=1 Tax=Pseudonocardia sp. TaxID=60912 RepID=UPI003D0A1C36